jgi:hypothetical protein
MPRKVRLYFPGMISLLGIPIFIWFFAPKKQSQQTVLKMFLPCDGPDRELNLFSKYSFLWSLKGKRVHHVRLKSTALPEGQDFLASQLTEILDEIAQLESRHDTTAVLEVGFDKNNSYSQFVWLLNQAAIFKLRHYAFFDDTFYLLANPPVDSSYNDSSRSKPIPMIYL